MYLKTTSFLFVVLFCFSECNTGEKKSSNFSEATFTGKNYFGVLPCASCPGIETRLTFYADSTVVKEEIYEDEDAMPFIAKLKYSIKKDTLILSLSAKPEENEKYFIHSLDSISLLNKNGKAVEGALADDYKLTLINADLTAKDIEGNYITGDGNKHKGYYETLTIKNINEKTYSVKVSHAPFVKGCTFDGKGILKGNKITIDLHEHLLSNHSQATMQSKMTVTFSLTKKAFIDIEEFEKYKYDLMYFCGGGESLRGDFTKEKNTR